MVVGNHQCNAANHHQSKPQFQLVLSLAQFSPSLFHRFARFLKHLNLKLHSFSKVCCEFVVSEFAYVNFLKVHKIIKSSILFIPVHFILHKEELISPPLSSPPYASYEAEKLEGGKG